MSAKQLELTKEQKAMAEEYEAKQKAAMSQQSKAMAKQEEMKKEAKEVATFLIGLEMKSRKTQLIIDGKDGKKKAVNC